MTSLYNFKDTEAEFVENTNPEEAIKLVNKNEAICFINVCKDDIKYFRNENGESTESKVFRNLYTQYMKNIYLYTPYQNSNHRRYHKF